MSLCLSLSLPLSLDRKINRKDKQNNKISTINKIIVSALKMIQMTHLRRGFTNYSTTVDIQLILGFINVWLIDTGDNIQEKKKLPQSLHLEVVL